MAEQPAFVHAFALAKRHNKERLAHWVQQHLGLTLDPAALFDVQVKRIHEYKRQLLNVLHVITRYHRMLDAPGQPWVPRVVVFAGKAASAYHMAKQIIHLINNVGRTINNDPRLEGRLKVVFLPNYSVSLAETIIPAADLSEQISTAGTEASGTGNMKFALNGALTIGTLDGANVEMRETGGCRQLLHLRPHHARGGRDPGPGLPAARAGGGQPRAAAHAGGDPRRRLQPRGARPLPPDLRHPGELGRPLLLLADYASYVATQEKVDELFRDPAAWMQKAIHNVAGMGYFSSDRTIAEYAHQIWHTTPVRLPNKL